LRKYGGDDFEVHSAGLEPKGLHPLTLQVMKEIGLDISHQQSKGVGVYLGQTFIHTLITVCDDADKNCPTTWPGVTQRLHWSFEDPAAVKGDEDEQVAKFRQVRDQIDQKIKDWLQAQE
jgi:arsenate reductase